MGTKKVKWKTKSRARSAAQNRGEGLLAPNMAELVLKFGTEEQCERYMIKLRWPHGFRCPRCAGRSYVRVLGRREFRCASCSWQFSATSGTAIAGTHLRLTAWFRACWALTSGPRGASAQGVAREMACADRSAHAVLDRLRALMGTEMALCRVGGEWVELDGADVSCGNDGRVVAAAGSGAGDAPVLVAVSASGAVLEAVPDQTAATVAAFCAAHVSRGCEVRTDCHPSEASALAGGWDAVAVPSGGSGDAPGTLPAAHHVISNLKAKLDGTHHGVTSAGLGGYCHEFGWMYSHRAGDPFAELLAAIARWPWRGVAGSRADLAPRAVPEERDADRRARGAAKASNTRARGRLLKACRERLVNTLAALTCAKEVLLTKS